MQDIVFIAITLLAFASLAAVVIAIENARKAVDDE